MLQPSSDSTCQRVSGEHPGEKRWSSYYNGGHINTKFIPNNLKVEEDGEMNRKGLSSTFTKDAPPASKECFILFSSCCLCVCV